MTTTIAREPDEPSNEEFCGMFSTKLVALKDLPTSLYFADKMKVPESARRVLKTIQDELLGTELGQKTGCYGACDGPVHIMYLGPAPSRSDPQSYLNLRTLLDLLHLSEKYRSYNWMTTVDPMHQQLFLKVRTGDEDASHTILLLDDVLEVLQTKIPTRRMTANVPAHVVTNYPSLEDGKLVFLLPRFSNMHDGDCEEHREFCPLAEAFHNKKAAKGEYWYQFQERSEANSAIILEASDNGTTMESGAIQLSPVLAIFETVTGGVFALANWDYRD